jgi:hypothetical protein
MLPHCRPASVKTRGHLFVVSTNTVEETMPRYDADKFSQSFDDTILDQDFDDWQSDDGLEDVDSDTDPDERDEDFDDVARDSHFLLRELDFAGEYESL